MEVEHELKNCCTFVCSHCPTAYTFYSRGGEQRHQLHAHRRRGRVEDVIHGDICLTSIYVENKTI
jgi:hypothetical protein